MQKPPKMSSEYYEIFSKHLNLIQIYIFGVAYLLPNTSANVETFVDTIKHTVNEKQILRVSIKDRLQDIFQSSLKYMDTPSGSSSCESTVC